jgi:hypothetical protein
VKLVRADGTTQILRKSVVLPPRLVEQEGGSSISVPRKLGVSAGFIDLVWPPLEKPTLSDTALATKAAGDAVLSDLIDLDTASRFLAPFFQVENVRAMRAKLAQKSAVQHDDGYAEAVSTRVQAKPAVSGEVKVYSYELDDGLFTIDEARSFKGLGKHPSGDGWMTVPQYKATHPEVFAAAANASAGTDAGSVAGIATDAEEP